MAFVTLAEVATVRKKGLRQTGATEAATAQVPQSATVPPLGGLLAADCGAPVEGPHQPARSRLLAFRRDVLRQLAAADQVEPGLLRLVADATAALWAIQEVEMPADAVPADRVVLSDDGATLRLLAYVGADRAAVVELTPMRALALAGELVVAARRRLP